MKAHINKHVPELLIYLEPNEKYGHGWQARQVIDGVSGKPLDYEPFSLGEVTGMVAQAVDTINEKTGYGYKVHEVIRITQEGLLASRDTDPEAAAVLRDIESGTYELCQRPSDDAGANAIYINSPIIQ